MSRNTRRIDLVDREEKQRIRDFGIEPAPRWRQYLGPTPVLAPRDFAGARMFLGRIQAVINRGGWTRAERNGIKILKRKWTEKAEGKNAWFNKLGNPYGGTEYDYYGGPIERPWHKEDETDIHATG